MKLSKNTSPQIKTELFDNLKYSLVTKSSSSLSLNYIIYKKLLFDLFYISNNLYQPLFSSIAFSKINY